MTALALFIFLFSTSASAYFPVLKWTYRIKPDIRPQSVAIIDNLVMIEGTSHIIHFVDKTTGKKYWEYCFYDDIKVYKLKDNNLIIISDNVIHRLDLNSKTRVWSKKLKYPGAVKLFWSEQLGNIAVKYNDTSYELFSFTGKAPPVEVKALVGNYTEITVVEDSTFRPDTAVPGSKLNINSSYAAFYPPGAELAEWTFSSLSASMVETAVTVRSSLALLSADGVVHILDQNTGAEKKSIRLKDVIDMRFWDEKPEQLNNYKNGRLISIQDDPASIFVIGPSSISRVYFQLFPDSVKLFEGAPADNQDSTINWALERAIDSWDRQDYKGALSGMQETVQIWPDSSLARLFLGMAYSSMNRTDESIDELTKALQLDPQNPDIIDNLAGNYMVKIISYSPDTQTDKIIDLYERIMELKPANALPYIGLAELYLGKKNYVRSASVIIKASERGFFGPDIESLLLSSYYMLDRTVSGFQTADEMIELYPYYDIPYLLKAKLLCKLGKYKEALQLFDRAPKKQEKNSASLFPRLLTAGSRFYYGNALGLSGKYPEAISVLTEFVNSIPPVEDLEILKSIKNNPNQAPADAKQAEILSKYKNTNPLVIEAESEFLSPALLATAHFQLLSNRKEDSLKTVKRIEQEANGDMEVLSYAGYLLCLNNKSLEHARDLINSALKKNPRDPLYLRNKAVYLFTTGNQKDAAETFRLALENGPKTELLHYEYGKFLESTGKYDDAERQYRAELELSSDLKLVSDALERIASKTTQLAKSNKTSSKTLIAAKEKNKNNKKNKKVKISKNSAVKNVSKTLNATNLSSASGAAAQSLSPANTPAAISAAKAMNTPPPAISAATQPAPESTLPPSLEEASAQAAAALEEKNNAEKRAEEKQLAAKKAASKAASAKAASDKASDTRDQKKKDATLKAYSAMKAVQNAKSAKKLGENSPEAKKAAEIAGQLTKDAEDAAELLRIAEKKSKIKKDNYDLAAKEASDTLQSAKISEAEAAKATIAADRKESLLKKLLNPKQSKTPSSPASIPAATPLAK